MKKKPTEPKNLLKNFSKVCSKKTFQMERKKEKTAEKEKGKEEAMSVMYRGRDYIEKGTEKYQEDKEKAKTYLDKGFDLIDEGMEKLRKYFLKKKWQSDDIPLKTLRRNQKSPN